MSLSLRIRDGGKYCLFFYAHVNLDALLFARTGNVHRGM
jgi:hypothetical protein